VVAAIEKGKPAMFAKEERSWYQAQRLVATVDSFGELFGAQRERDEISPATLDKT